MNLQALQTSFQQTVLNAECVGTDWVSTSKHGLSSQSRLAIYHNAYRVRLIDVLMDTFEHTAIYLGDEWFHTLASRFVQSHGSTHDNIGYYGHAFPQFLEEQLPNDLEVAELALMDWTLRRAFDGADSAAMTLDHLQQLINGERVIERLSPVPTLSVTKQRFNTLDIWHAINQDEQPPVVESLPEAVHVVIWRKGHSPHFRSISLIEATAIASLCAGDTLDAIGITLSEKFPGVDAAAEFGSMLHRWITEEMLKAP